MNHITADAIYWAKLKDTLKAFSKAEHLERYLFNSADLEEVINIIFDDLDVERNISQLSKRFSHLQLFGKEYFQDLRFLTGDGPHITKGAPIYNPDVRKALHSRTCQMLDLIDELIISSKKIK